MAPDPEAQAQLARLLGDQGLRSADLDSLHDAIDHGFERLADGLLAEAAASDDVSDRESALSFISDRLRSFDDLLQEPQRSRLRQAVQAKIEAW